MKKFFVTIIFLILSYNVNSKPPKLDWNHAELEWLDYEQGIAEIKKTGKPGLFIIYADWCPTCKKYSKLFTKENVVDGLSDIVLIRVNKDEEPELSRTFSFDGEYVPRTFALNNKGEIIKKFYNDKAKYTYFIPSGSPEFLIEFAKLIKKFGNS